MMRKLLCSVGQMFIDVVGERGSSSGNPTLSGIRLPSRSLLSGGMNVPPSQKQISRLGVKHEKHSHPIFSQLQNNDVN